MITPLFALVPAEQVQDAHRIEMAGEINISLRVLFTERKLSVPRRRGRDL